MLASLAFPHGTILCPAFLPDATRGVVRAIDAEDLQSSGVPGLVMSTFHLMQHPGSSTIKALGGLHRMAGWSRPIITDSGGFQAYSLIRQQPKRGFISSKGLAFQPDGADRPFRLSPEKTIQLQLAYGSDAVICLDDCRHPDEPEEAQAESVRRTIDWARRGKAEFERLAAAAASRPKLFAVIQGGASRELRRRCADELLTLDFDGFGFGGWPLSGSGELLLDMLSCVRELVPASLPLHALGIGHPLNVAACVALGYELFDSALPTRDARQGRLYTLAKGAAWSTLTRLDGCFHYLYAQDLKHSKTSGPIYETCDCYVCRRYSLAYLHHLLASKDILFQRLATIHNLTFMAQLMTWLRAGVHG